MDFAKKNNIRKTLIYNKLKCLQAINEKTFSEEYELYYCKQMLRQGNEHPLVKVNDPEYFDIVKREIEYWSNEVFGRVRFAKQGWYYKLQKRLWLLQQEVKEGIVQDRVAPINEQYLKFVLEPELKFRNEQVFKSKRAEVENQIKAYYLQDEIDYRNEAIRIAMEEKDMIRVPGQLSQFDENKYDIQAHYDAKERKFNRIVKLLERKKEILIYELTKIREYVTWLRDYCNAETHKGGIDAVIKRHELHAANKELKIFKVENDIFAKQEFIYAYKSRVVKK